MKKLIACLLAFIIAMTPVSVFADVSRTSTVTSGASTVTPGYYYLVPVCAPNRTLSILSASKKTGATACTGTLANKSQRVWKITAAAGGSYSIKNMNSNMVLSAKNNTTAVGGAVIQESYTKLNRERWYFIKSGSYYIIQSSISRRVLGVHNGSTANAAKVNLQAYSGVSKQKWALVKYVKGSQPKSPVKSTTKYKTTNKKDLSAADYAVLNNIIGAVETGGQVYGQRDYGDYTAPYTNSSIEYTCTLGWGAFYGDEAQYLIKSIKTRAPKTFAAIDKKGLIAKKLEVNWVKTRWKPNATEIALLKKLITTSIGKKIQDEMVTKLMKSYAARCKASFTNNTFALMMYCEISHLGGVGAANRIFSRCGGNYTLDGIVASLYQEYNTANKVGSRKFWSRHMKCVEFIEKYAA
ncbi:MAG: RICIN domain-containing protein [Lachnospiraceae bacterium]|nr:RICIN domain-containing protein [Lachnospiraceae bacterium]